MGSSYRQLWLIMREGSFFTQKSMKSWDSAKNRVSGVVPVLLVSSTWDTERCHRYAFAHHEVKPHLRFAKKSVSNCFLANVEHTWRRAVVFHLLMSVVRGGGVATKRSKSYSLLFCPFSLWQKGSLVNIFSTIWYR